MTKLISLIALTLLIVFPAYSAPKLKKISIAESNNAPYFLYSGEAVFAKRDLGYLKELKAYVESHGFPLTEQNGEIDFIVSSLKWVSSQWDHDGMNEPSKGANALDVLKAVYEKKIKYRCVEYGLVLSDILQAYGFVTRTVALRAVDVAYGKPGSGHVATEVWSNSLNKWIFLDGQFGLYLTEKGRTAPLNYFELFQERKAGHWSELEVHFLKPSSNVANDAAEYKYFLSNNFGYFTVSDGLSGSPRVSLSLESPNQSVTFQGLQLDDIIFTDDVKLVYPKLNQVAVLLKYKKASADFKSIFDKLKIDSDDDYLNNMGAFAAEPNFIAKLKTTEPFFDHYEYRIDSRNWISLKGDSVEWDVKKSTGRIEVRAVNKFARSGPVTFIAVTYN